MINLPNFLTILRILLIPLFVHLVLHDQVLWALLIFAAASITDGLDGYIARVYHLKTRLGAMLDPLADKLLLLTAYILLAGLHRIPLWLTEVVVARDMIILSGILFLFVTKKEIDFSPSVLGKVTTFVQLATVLCVLVSDLTPRMGRLLPPLYLVNLFATLSSCLHYFYVGFRMHTGTMVRSNGG